MKKIAALVLGLMLGLSAKAIAEEAGSVYYLQFKPEVAEAWVELGEL